MNKHKYFPQNKEELKEIIFELVKAHGKEANLNCIDTHAITDMSNLFAVSYVTDPRNYEYLLGFNGDISEWDVSNVTNMKGMFSTDCAFEGTSRFNGDLSKWDVSRVTDMSFMFYQACSFNGDISTWNVSNVKDMGSMFCGADIFNQDISGWDVSNVEMMDYMFNYALGFNCNLAPWDVRKVKDMSGMFLCAASFDCDISGWELHPEVRMYELFDEIDGYPSLFQARKKPVQVFITHDGKECRIRHATIGDAAFIAKGVNCSIDNQGEEPKLLDLAQTAWTLYDYHRTLIAEIDGTAVGCIVSYLGDEYRQRFDNSWSRLHFEEQAKKGEFHIDTVYVVPECRRKSIASHLIEAAIALAEKDYEFDKVTLVVMPGKPDLVTFYEKNGFVKEGTRPLYGTPYILMSKDKIMNITSSNMPKNDNGCAAFAAYCEKKLTNISEEANREYGYHNPALCALDAVFSLRSRYTQVVNVVKRFNGELEPLVKGVEIDNSLTLSETLRILNQRNLMNGESLADKLENHCLCPGTKRLKADCFLELLRVMQMHGIETVEDLALKCNDNALDIALSGVKGLGPQGRNYLFMLAGVEELVKVDVHIRRYVAGFDATITDTVHIQKLFRCAARILSKQYPGLTARKLDNIIWRYQRNRKGNN